MPKILYATVAQSGQVSGDINLSQYWMGSIRVPTITSGDMYVHGNVDTTSNTFYRLMVESGDLRFPTGPGSRMVMWPLGQASPLYARVEFSVAQADVRTLTIQAF